MECNKLRPEYHLLELVSAVIKILLYGNHSICLNEMCSRYLTNFEAKGIFTKGANVTTTLGSKEELLFQFSLPTSSSMESKKKTNRKGSITF